MMLRRWPVLSFLSTSEMSPIITLTNAYSIKLKNTKTVQEDMKMSMAYRYKKLKFEFFPIEGFQRTHFNFRVYFYVFTISFSFKRKIQFCVEPTQPSLPNYEHRCFILSSHFIRKVVLLYISYPFLWIVLSVICFFLLLIRFLFSSFP